MWNRAELAERGTLLVCGGSGFQRADERATGFVSQWDRWRRPSHTVNENGAGTGRVLTGEDPRLGALRRMRLVQC
jgi:hypothetical protein